MFGDKKMVTFTQYTPNHSVSDLTGLVIDGVVEFGITIVGFIGLIALVYVYTLARKQLK